MKRLNSSHLCRRRGAGFTLVELLVVIGIIALLISILLPALNKARQQANTVKCMSNMRQLVQTAYLFAADHNGYFPDAFYDSGPTGGLLTNGAVASTGPWNYTYPYYGWQTIYLQNYIKSTEVFLCPADTSNEQYGTWIDKSATMWASYCYNESNNCDEGFCLKFSQFHDPTRTIMYAEKHTIQQYPNAIVTTWLAGDGLNGDADYGLGYTMTNNVAYDRHGGNKIGSNQSLTSKGMSNYAFLDGHVETLSWNATWQHTGPQLALYGGVLANQNMWKRLALPSPNFYGLIYGEYYPNDPF